ncbi:MAG TPA: hypothetical protein PKA21_06310 [Kiritimatiellia bacterium]|nr:hypothetical protein [Kiritimatiellia bacterium]
MTLLAIILIAGLPAAWLFAEFRAGKVLRITFGSLSIITICFMLYTALHVTQQYERQCVATSLNEIRALISAGQTDRILSAIDAYEIARTNDAAFSFSGSSTLMSKLRQINEDREHVLPVQPRSGAH